MDTAAKALGPLVSALLGSSPIELTFWDDSTIPAADPAAPKGTLHVRSPDAVARILWRPDELGIGRAYVAGEVDVDGDIIAVIEALRDAMPSTLRERRTAAAVVPKALAAARSLGLLKRPPPPPAHEARLHGWRHSIGRDRTAVSYHYDTGNDFYRVVLGPSMTYSCARFSDPTTTLEQAQAAKHELICRKLGLAETTADSRTAEAGGAQSTGARRRLRLLDVGCGWGSMAIHAATQHDVEVVGITLSREQAELARRRVADAGVADRVEIRLQDYRQLDGETFDAISSIGMSEHVGHANLKRYFEILHAALTPTGRLLNHCITSVGGSKMRRNSFVGRYVFPDGELVDAGNVVLAMEQAGFELRDVESLREHYARTLRGWLDNLERDWDAAVAAADEAKARIWRLYMAASAVGFEDNGIAIHQFLGVVPTAAGDSAMPPTRAAWS